MMRFIVEKKLNSDFFELTKETLKHMKVARQINKHFICVFEEEFYECVLEQEKAKIIQKLNLNHEYEKPVALAIPLISWKNFELVLQKATELGVTEFYPFISQYCELKETDFERKRDRFEKIIFEASQQSFRNRQPFLNKIKKFDKIITLEFKNKYLAHEKTSAANIASYPSDSLFVIGPEGGFSDTEVNLALQNNFTILKLTKTILRAETACLYVLSRVNE
ncbi:16S rRNA (uracil(1498)-N(3))-methyltransferase [Mycoplasma phocoenae]|uniref:Ribosomal RNA small subunit methyltransferase E n=1 Tax=Mycoplasma phocoenae TaxID=754517 RepID=A0A858U8T3_9MOLU|nr:16S rRNA (uracil(1498)-N(3))-methyltransferase [Mycoplasma phocoenae]QJG67116.1 16S rRNA (uracil(1498)-N(3))-methyltransferase [Mycoplasma phocoenae]